MPENNYTEPDNSPSKTSTYAEMDFSQGSSATQTGSDSNNHNLSEMDFAHESNGTQSGNQNQSEDTAANIDGYTEFSPAPPPRPALPT